MSPENMKKFLFFSAFMLYFFTSGYGQTMFQKTYGFQNTFGSTVEQTIDGGYIVFGTILIGNNYSFYLVKIDANGDISWTKLYDEINSFQVIAKSGQITADGGYIIMGTVLISPAVVDNILLIKTDSNGNLLWSKTYGGPGDDAMYSIQQTTDGGYILAGLTSSYANYPTDVYLIKTDANGDTVWTKTYGGLDYDGGYSIKQTTDGGYIILGSSNFGASGSDDIYLIKTDSSGNALWSKTYGGTNQDIGASVLQTADGGYILACNTRSFGTGTINLLLIKTDAAGDTLWSKSYGESNFSGLNVSEIEQTIDGGYIAAASFSGISSNQDACLIKFNALGDTLWTKKYGGANPSAFDIASSVHQATDGGYIIAGSTNALDTGYQRIYIVKTDSMGVSGCHENGMSINITPASPQTANFLTIVSGTNTVIGSPAILVDSGGYVSYPCLFSNTTEISDSNPGITIYPNPVSNELRIQNLKSEIRTIEIYDMLNQRVFFQPQTSNFKPQTIDVSLLPSGLYFVKVTDVQGNRGTRKFVKM